VADIQQLIRTDVPAPTAAGTVHEPALPPATAGELIPVVASLRYRSDLVHTDAIQLNRDVYTLHLSERTASRERQAVRTLLDDITASGLSWTLVARILGVSVPAIRKWRLGEGASPANRHAVARLAALLDMLAEQFLIEDPAAWLEIPLAGTPLTLADVFTANRDDLVLEYAAGWIASAEALLNEFDPTWREAENAREFETFQAPDGGIGIRLRAGK
jgi:hypothetical protein